MAALGWLMNLGFSGGAEAATAMKLIGAGRHSDRRIRYRGRVMVMKLTNTTAAQTWSFEDAHGEITVAGLTRSNLDVSGQTVSTERRARDFRIRKRGRIFVLKLSNTTSNETWSIETVHGEITVGGLTRV